MRRFKRGGPLLYGLLLLAVAALAVTGAASGNHWEDYTGSADSHELHEGSPDLCPATAGGVAFRVDAGDLTDGGEYPAGNPVVKITDLDVDGGTLSWALLPSALDLYDVDAVVMQGGENAMIYYYDAGQGGLDDSDSGLTTPIDENADPRRPYELDHVDFCFDPKGGTGVKRLEVTKTATTSWEKVYTWDVEKSVDPSQLEMKTGETGVANWKVDVTQTGFTARNAVVSGTITVSNPNGVDVTGVSVVDALPGAVVDCDGTAGEPYVSSGLTVPANGNVQCAYTAARDSSNGGTNEATATGTLDGVDVSDSGSADFAFGEPSAEINKTVEAVDGRNTWSGIGATTSFTYAERFTCSSEGRTNVVDLLGDNPATAQVETDYELDTDSATVTVRCSSTPPPDVCPNLEGNQATVPPGMVKDGQGNCVTPPPKTDEHMDVQVFKDATPQVQLVNGQANVTYTVRVRNNGPNQAHNVVLSDAAPGGVTFLAVTQQPVGGNCTVSAGLLNCTLGTVVLGVDRVIGVSARVTQTGTYSNCATAVGDGKDTNGANNTACASTLVTAPVTPPVTPPTPKPKPKPHPKPKPKPELCRVLKVTPGMVKADGERHVLIAKVTKSRTPVKGVKVRFSGIGVHKVVRTDRHGVARLGVRPGKAGIMLVRITNVKACNSARIGVVGVFEPPVTG